MQVLIDADGCPVVKETIDESTRYNEVQVIIICDTAHVINYPNIQTITVAQGADSVDFKLVNLIKAGDLVITQDYGLAAMSLAKKARVLRQDGMEYTQSNIDGLLAERHENKKIRRSGKHIGGSAKRTAKDNENFLAGLRKILGDN